MTGVSIRQFAKLDGCAESLVRSAIAKGRLTRDANGKLDPALAGTGWRQQNRRAAEAKERDAADLPEALEQVRNFLSDVLSGKFATVADAEQAKENALAALRIVELLVKTEQLVEVKDVAAIVGNQLARVRTKMLAIPAECAPRLAALNSISEIQDFLGRIVTEALEELAGYDGDKAG